MPIARLEQTYSIRQLCNEFGATPRALRFYEDKGLLTPRRQGASRLYNARDRVRLKLILRSKRVGFSLNEISQMLDLYDRADGGADHIAAMLVKYRDRIAALRLEREEIEGAIRMLEEGCAQLEGELGKQGPTPPHRTVDYDLASRLRLGDHGVLATPAK